MSHKLQNLLVNPALNLPENTSPETILATAEQMTIKPYQSYCILAGDDILSNQGILMNYKQFQKESHDKVIVLTWEKDIPETLSLQDYIESESIDHLFEKLEIRRSINNKIEKNENGEVLTRDQLLALYLWGAVQLMLYGETRHIRTVQVEEDENKYRDFDETFCNAATAFKEYVNHTSLIYACYEDSSESFITELYEIPEHACGVLFRKIDETFSLESKRSNL